MTDNKPARQFYHSGWGRGVSLGAWSNPMGGYNFKISKSYKDKNTGEWKNGNSYFAEDLAAIQTLITQAIIWADEQHAYQKISGSQDLDRPKDLQTSPMANTQIEEDELPF